MGSKGRAIPNRPNTKDRVPKTIRKFFFINLIFTNLFSRCSPDGKPVKSPIRSHRRPVICNLLFQAIHQTVELDNTGAIGGLQPFKSRRIGGASVETGRFKTVPLLLVGYGRRTNQIVQTVHIGCQPFKTGFEQLPTDEHRAYRPYAKGEGRCPDRHLQG